MHAAVGDLVAKMVYLYINLLGQESKEAVITGSSARHGRTGAADVGMGFSRAGDTFWAADVVGDEVGFLLPCLREVLAMGIKRKFLVYIFCIS